MPAVTLLFGSPAIAPGPLDGRRQPVGDECEPGEVVTVTSDDEPWAEVLVNGVDVVKKYDDEYFDDTRR